MALRHERLFVIGVGLLIASGALPARPAVAAVRYAAPTAAGAGDCGTWQDACTLQAALSGAAAGDQVWARAGLHLPGVSRSDTFGLRSGVAVYGGFAGTETSLAERDPAAHVTVLSGDVDGNDANADGNSIAETTADVVGANSYHVLNGGGADATAILDGFTVTAGQADGAWPNNGAGGMDVRSGSPTLARLHFAGNLGAGAGGAVYTYLASPTLTDVRFSGNAARDGGGMYVENGTPSLTRVTFAANAASGKGGGLNAYWAGNATLSQVDFIGNTAGSGGGMYVDRGSSPSLARVRFLGNSAANGGGMMTFDGSAPTLVNVGFSGNAASDGGGGLLNDWSAPTLTNVTFSANTAASGGGLHNRSGSSPVLANCILWGNAATADGSQIRNYDGASVPVISASDVQGSGGSGAGWDPLLGSDGGGNVDADPLFVDPDGADDLPGTADDSPRLRGASPARDAGDDAAVPAGVTTDLDGAARFSGARVDMGAYEHQIASATFRSLGAQDGWVLEAGETAGAGGTLAAGGTTFNLGDDALDRQYRAILSFDTSALPDAAVVTRVSLMLKPQGTTGTSPFATHGRLLVDARRGPFGGSAALQALDFQAAATTANAGSVAKTPAAGWHTGAWTQGAPKLVNRVGTTQLRLRFARDDDDDLRADVLRLFSGNAPALSRPRLVVEYYEP